MVNAAQIAKEGARAVMAPPQDAVSAAKLASRAVMAPPQTAVSVAKLRVYAVITEKVIIVPDYMWPHTGAAALIPRKAKLSLMPFNTTGGQGFSNVEQVVGNTPGRLRIDLSEIQVKTDDQRLAWENLEFQLRGRTKTIGVPLYRWMANGVPWPTIMGALTTSAPGYTTKVILAYANAQILEGAVVCTIRMVQGAALKVGNVFGFNYKVYYITEITSVGSTDSPPYPTYTVKFWPPLRERIELNEQLEFDNPILRCRLSEDNAMTIEGGWDYWKRGSPSLSFFEDVTTEP